MKDIDWRTTTRAPWQQRNSNQSGRKPFIKKKRTYTNLAGEEDDDPDAYALDEPEEEYSENDEWEHADYEEDDEEDPDQVAYVDDDGNFHADQETINAVDEMLSWEDDEYAKAVISYTEARKALAQARIMRGFYPVVIPASSGSQPRFGRDSSNQSKGRGKRGKKSWEKER